MQRLSKIGRYLSNITNIKPDRNQRCILFTTALCCLLTTYISPVLLKETISQLPAEWLAFESLFISIASFVIGVLWRGKLRKTVIKLFNVLIIIESVCGFSVGMYLFFNGFNAWLYAIASLLYISFVSFLIAKCTIYIKSRLWTAEGRELFDNNDANMTSIVCIIGYLTALLCAPSIKVALLIWSFCHIIDNVGWFVMYRKNKSKLCRP